MSDAKTWDGNANVSDEGAMTGNEPVEGSMFEQVEEGQASPAGAEGFSECVEDDVYDGLDDVALDGSALMEEQQGECEDGEQLDGAGASEGGFSLYEDGEAGESASSDFSAQSEACELPVDDEDDTPFGIWLKDYLIIGVIALVFGIAFAWLGTFASGSSALNEDAVAATVNGEAITEKEVSNEVSKLRDAKGLASDEDWAEWLSEYNMDVEGLREALIEQMVAQKLLIQAAHEHGVVVTDEDLDAEIEEVKAAYASSVGNTAESSFEDELESAGYTIDSYKEVLIPYIYDEKLTALFAEDVAEPTDEEILEIANIYFLDGDQQAASVDELDEETFNEIKEGLKLNAGYDAFNEWFSEFKQAADIQINDMPANVPYYVKVELKEQDESITVPDEFSFDDEEGYSESEIEVFEDGDGKQ